MVVRPESSSDTSSVREDETRLGKRESRDVILPPTNSKGSLKTSFLYYFWTNINMSGNVISIKNFESKVEGL